MTNPPILNAWQGRQTDYAALQINLSGSPPTPAVFPSNTTLSAVVWEGQNQASLFAPVVAWSNSGTGWAQGQFSISFLPSPITALDPAGEYHLLVSTTDVLSVTRPAWEGLVRVVATPGSTSPSPPDLVTYDYCLGQLQLGGPLTNEQIACLPTLITAASDLFRLECNERYFDMRNLVEWHQVALDGYVRLWQEPIQIITRVQGIPNLALNIVNNSQSVQTSQVYFSFTGFDGGYNSNAKTATGIILNWVSNGTPSTTTLLYATYPTVGQIATAISSVGSGWSAQVTTGFASWSCSELVGGFIAQGTSVSQLPTNGCLLNVLTDISNAQLNPRTPLLWVGRQYGGNSEALRWGPGGYELFSDGGQGQNTQGVVKVSYQAGFNTIPLEVQNQVVQVVKWKLALGIQDLLLRMESAGDYKYELAPEMVGALPKNVKEAIGRWKYHYA